MSKVILEKKCKTCEVIKPIAEFARAGPKYYQSYCKDCAHSKRADAYRIVSKVEKPGKFKEPQYA